MKVLKKAIQRALDGGVVANCKDCGHELEPLNPHIEEYVDYKILIRVPFTNWKFMLLRDYIEHGCISCQIEEESSREHEQFCQAAEAAYHEGFNDGRMRDIY